MRKIVIRKINFGSFVKLFSLVWLSLGIVIGIFQFILIGFFGVGSMNLNGTIYTGFVGGVMALLLVPILLAIISTIWGALAYLPFRLIMRFLNKLNITGEFEASDMESNNGIQV